MPFTWPSLSAAAAALIALAPGAYAWLTGRRLLRHVDDAAFPELLLANRQRLSLAAAAGLATLIVLSSRQAAWALPLLLVALVLGGFPVRRTLLDERWSAPVYLWHTVLSGVGTLGFWMLVALAPTLIASLSRLRTPAAIGLGVILLCWEINYRRLWLLAHGGSPLRRDDLRARFDAVVDRAGVPQPAIHRVGVPGSRLPLAVALPGTPGAVAMSDAMLELLEPEEIVAVFAHEVAHLEYYDRRRVLRLRLLTYLIIAAAVAVPLLLPALAPGALPWMTAVWPLSVLLLLGRRLSTTRRLETESDLRGAELCGNGEALVLGLTKLHRAVAFPRRWPHDFEQRATHPSLARRIQAIRGAAGAPTATLAAPVVLRSPAEGQYVVLESGRATWLEGVPADAPRDPVALRERAASVRSMAYAELTELRIATTERTRAIKATDRAGKSWLVTIDPADVVAAQQALDVVDVRLGHRVGTPAESRVIWRALAAAILFAALAAGQLGLLLVPVALTIFWPSVASVAALGAMAVARAAASALAAEPIWGTAWRGGALAALAVLGSLTIWMAINERRREKPEMTRPRLTFAALGTVALVPVVALLWSASRGALDWSVVPAFGASLGAALVGFGAAMLVLPRRGARLAGGSAVAGALVLGALSVRAAEFERTSGIAWTEGRAVEVGNVRVGGTAGRLRLSPMGTRFALLDRATERVHRRYRTVATVGRFDGLSRDVEAADVAFVDEGRFLAVASIREGVEVRLESVDSAPAPAWRDTLSLEQAEVVSVDGERGSWTILGHDAETEELLVFTGVVETGLQHTARWAADSMRSVGMLSFDGGTLIVPMLEPMRASTLPLLYMGLDPFRWKLWRVTNEGRRMIGTLPGHPSCAQPERERAALCVVRQRDAASLWSISEAGEVVRLGTLPFGYGPVSIGPGGRVAALPHTHDLLLVDGPARRGVRLALPEEAGYASDIQSAPGLVATLRVDSATVTVTLYRAEGRLAGR